MTEPTPRVRLTIGRTMLLIAIVAGCLGAIAWASRLAAFGRFTWFASSALEIGTLIPWTPWVGGAGLLIGSAAIAFDKRLWRRRTSWLGTPFLVPMLILIYGILFAHPRGALDGPMPWMSHEQIISLSPWLHVPIALVLFLRLPRAWLATIGLSAAAWYWSFGASVMAWMSVTNIWL